MKRPRMMVSVFLMAALLMVSGCMVQTDTQEWSGPVDRVVNFQVTGKGVAPENSLNKGQAILMAEKAAVADGYRKLVEKIRGVYVDAYLKSGQGVVDYDIVQAHTQSWIRGAEVLEIHQAEFGITEAIMRLRVNFTRRGMIWWPVGIGQEMVQSPMPYEAQQTSNVNNN
ncbi:MAG: hypothetical protein V1793_14425 [Pseudomonadota bacterium]